MEEKEVEQKGKRVGTADKDSVLRLRSERSMYGENKSKGED